MAFRRRSRRSARQGVLPRVLGLAHAVLLVAARLALSVAALAVLAAVIVYLRLQQGPIALPGMARMLAEQVNEASDRVRLDIGNVVLTLGDGAATSGLQFRDVELRAPDGQRLLAARRVGARFHLADLLQGRVQPVRITLIEPDTQIIRAEDGGVRVGLGPGTGVSLQDGGGGDGLAALARLIDGAVGDLPPVPELAKLQRIEILGANLTFDDRQGGGHWSTENANLRVWRYPGGARASLDVVPPRGGSAALSLVADRAAGSGRTALRLTLGGLEAGQVASDVGDLDWLRLLGGTVAGEASATLERDGRLGAVEGVIVAEGGMIRGAGAPVPVDTAELRFRADPAEDRLVVRRLTVRGPSLSAELGGYAELDRDAGGAVQGLAGQFDIGSLHLDMPDVFAAPLDIDGGRLTARWSMPAQRIEVTDSRLVRGDLAVTLDGQAQRGEGGWTTDLRAQAAGMTAADLVALWPVSSAANARHWVEKHVTAGMIDNATAQVRLGPAEPLVSVDFAYSTLSIDYIDGMSPVEDGRGTGHVSLHDLFMDMEHGHGAPLPGAPIDLAGSSLAIRNFWGDISTADVSIRATGPVDAALALIDQPPLRLTRRLGRPLDVSSGTASVVAKLSIPLLKDVLLADVSVEARATLSDVAMPFAISPGRTVDVRGGQMELAADTGALHLSGDARIDGADVGIDWNEAYGKGRDDRSIKLSGTATPELLAAVGGGGLPIRGSPGYELELRQTGGSPLAFTLDADLQPTGLEIPGLDWTKPADVPALLHAEGVEDGGGLDIKAMTFDSSGLAAQGSLRLDADGGLVRGAFSQIRLAELGTFAATLGRAPDGVLEIGLSGQRLDLSERVENAGSSRDGSDGTATPLRLSLTIDRLRLGKRILLAPASGTVEQSASGALSGQVAGRLGAAPVTLVFDIPATGAGTVRLTSPDAGGVLRATDLYSDAEGGALVIVAQVGQPDGAALSGEARIQDMRVRSQSTFRTMLSRGGLDSAEQEVASNGIGFHKVSIPFAYRDGVLRLKNAIAASPALGLKVNGTVDERTDMVDLVGVLSPAYGLTGALNEVPLLGQILGGEGEGVLAMTFRLTGSGRGPALYRQPAVDAGAGLPAQDLHGADLGGLGGFPPEHQAAEQVTPASRSTSEGESPAARYAAMARASSRFASRLPASSRTSLWWL